MFQIGDYVNYGVRGLCKIKAIRALDEMKTNDDRLYYELIPENQPDSKIFIPVNAENTALRSSMTSDEAWRVIHMIPSIKALEIENEKRREITYKNAINSGDYIQWIKLIKALYHKKEKRLREGKGLTGVDGSYVAQAEDLLYTELAVKTGIKKDAVALMIAKERSRGDKNQTLDESGETL